MTTSTAAVELVDTGEAQEVQPSLLEVPSDEDQSKHSRYDSDDSDIVHQKAHQESKDCSGRQCSMLEGDQL